MANITVKSGRRGRPLSINIDEAYNKILDLLPKASPRLKALRKSSKGIRGADIFGTQTSMPEWVEQTIDILDSVQGLDIKPTYQDVKQIKQTINSLQQLSSKQKKVYERALADQLTEEYLDELNQFEKSTSSYARAQVKAIKQQFLNLSKRQRQKFLTSKAYQDPKTTGRYKRVKNWAQADSGRTSMTYQEAWAYLFNERAKRGLETQYMLDIDLKELDK